MNRVIDVNLTTRKVDVIETGEDILRQYIGGSGLGAKILWDRKAYLYNPLSENNPLVFMTGPFINTPVFAASKFAIVAKSPLTGIFGESDSGGTWGPTLKRAGYDGIIVTGKSDKPVYLWVSEAGVEIRDAGHLWGKDSIQTAVELCGETTEKAVIACIGTSGEKLIPLASIMNDGVAARAAARCGLGAVMGSKNLKAIAVYGSMKTPIHDRKALLQALGDISKSVREKAAGLTKLGTDGGLASFEEMGALPLRNWKGSERWNEGAAEITGATMAERIVTGNYGCEGCIVRCGRKVRFTDSRYGTVEGAGPEYETFAALGSLCLISDLNAIAKGNDLCNRYGIDTISTGAMVAFAMEAYERGIITKSDTDGLELTWGNADAMVETVKMIGENHGLGIILAKGVRAAAKELGRGAEEFAIHCHGLEFPGHDPRAYMTLAVEYATSVRGACHMSGFSHGFERALTLPEIGLCEVPDRMATENKGVLVALSQDAMGLFDSLKACKFLLFGGVKLTHMAHWYEKITGEQMTIENFMVIGERIFNLKRLFNLKCGMPTEDDVVPDRILNLSKEAEGWRTKLPPFAEILKEYYAHRGWDDKGVPTSEKLSELGL